MLLLVSLLTMAPVTVQAQGETSQTIASLVEHVAGLANRLDADERRALPAIFRELARLRADAARAARTRDERLTGLIRAAIHRISLAIADLPRVPRQDEFGVRTEPDLGIPDCRVAEEGSDHCSGDGWLSTRSLNFVNIRKQSFMVGSFEFPQGVQVNASFVAERDDTVMAATFSAEAFVDDDVPGANRRMFVRALLDGAPAQPSDVVFASTEHQGTRQFTFTALVDAGIHTVEIQWLVDDGATGYLSNANLLVRTGRSIPSALGTLAARTPPSGPNVESLTSSWSDVPGTDLWFYAPRDAVTTVTFNAEAFVTNGKAIAARALIDNVIIDPSDAVFARDNTAQSRGFTFGRIGLAQGWHQAKVQWLVEPGGTGTLGDRSIVVASYPSPTSGPTHPFIAAPSGPNFPLPIDGLQALPGMSTPVFIPAKGNGEVAVIFSAEVVSVEPAQVLLRVDGVFQLETLTELTDGTVPGQAKSYTLEAKHLAPGPHNLEIWIGGAAGSTQLGDRTIAAMSETGYVPDLAEAPALAGGRPAEDHIGGIEPLIGPRNVLTILFDPYDCGKSVDCFDETSFTPADMTNALFGPTESTNDYFRSNSGGRFSIVNAGVTEWLHADHPADYYWDEAWQTCDYNDSGFSSGHAARVSEAVQAAHDAGVDFASFDVNRDGELNQHELAILVVVPGPGGGGSSLAELLAAQCPGAERLSLGGVLLPRWINGWFTNLDDNETDKQYVTAAHELLHQFSVLDDLYIDVDHATFTRKLTVMSSSPGTSTHLDPIQKLGLGWVTPRLVDTTTQVSLRMVEQSNRVVVLPRYNGPANGEEFYVLENRREDAGVGLYDHGILDSGIGVWHVVTDAAEALKHPIGVTQAFWDTTAGSTALPGHGSVGRLSIRLLRPWVALTVAGVAVFVSKDDTLWDNTKYALKSAVCPALFLGEQFAAQNVLAWADCTASGYGVEFLSAPSANMTVRITAQ